MEQDAGHLVPSDQAAKRHSLEQRPLAVGELAIRAMEGRSCCLSHLSHLWCGVGVTYALSPSPRGVSATLLSMLWV